MIALRFPLHGERESGGYSEKIRHQIETEESSRYHTADLRAFRLP